MRMRQAQTNPLQEVRPDSSVPDDNARGLGGIQEKHLPIVEKDRHAVGSGSDDSDASAGNEANLLPGAKCLGVAVRQPVDDSPSRSVEFIERATGEAITGAIGTRNRIPVGITGRVAQHAVEAIEEPI